MAGVSALRSEGAAAGGPSPRAGVAADCDWGGADAGTVMATGKEEGAPGSSVARGAIAGTAGSACRPGDADPGAGSCETGIGDRFTRVGKGAGRAGGGGVVSDTGFADGGSRVLKSTVIVPAGKNRVPPPAGTINTSSAAATWITPDRKTPRARSLRSPAAARRISAGE